MQGCLFQVHPVFTVEYSVTWRSYLTCQNELGCISRFSCAEQIDNISSGEPFLSAESLHRVT